MNFTFSYKSPKPSQIPSADSPLYYDPEGTYAPNELKTLFIFVAAGRMIYNFSGIVPMIPLGIGSLVAYLKQHGYHNNAVLDQPGWGLSEKALFPLLLQHPFDLYALSTNIFSLSTALRLAQFVKERVNPKSTVVIGGPSGAFAPETILSECQGVDAVQVGEGETAILRMIKLKAQGKEIKNIPGLYWREGNYIRNGGKFHPIDLTEAPLPFRNLFPNDKYHIHPPLGVYGRVASLESIRGCDYGCNFCSIQHAVRFRAIEQVLEEMSRLILQGYREFHFIDPTFSIDQERAWLLCEAIIRKLPEKIYWSCKNRLDTVTFPLLKLMKRAGCYTISYGVESGDNDILYRIKKSIDAKIIRKTLRDTHEAGIRSLAYILIGSPGETLLTVKSTVDLMKDEKVDFVLFGEMMPDTDSPLFRNLIHQGVISKEAVKSMILNENRDKFQGYTPSGRDRETISKWLSYANRAFYGRPAYILQRIRGMLSLRDVYNMLYGVINLVKEFGRKDIYD